MSVILDKAGLARMIVRLSHEIEERNEGTEGVCLLGIKRGGEAVARRVAEAFAARGVFVPYASKEEAGEIYPEYIKMLEKSKEGDVYFYHCPKINDCNRCTDYENRPQICRDFPDNPLSLLPKSCGFYSWRQEVEPVALMLHSMLEIIEYYKEHITLRS